MTKNSLQHRIECQKHRASPLADLALTGQKVALVGASPSLDLCVDELEQMAKENFFFVLADSVAEAIVPLLGDCNRIIFTVETRAHPYLRRLEEEKIAAYVGMRAGNLPAWPSELFLFHLSGEAQIGESSEMVSPGTVLGIGFAWALGQLLRGDGGVLALVGADFSYPDQRIYSRRVASAADRSGHCLNRRENHEYLVALQKTSHIWMKQGYAIRTGPELLTAKTHIEKLLDGLPDGIEVVDYSPLGLSHSRIEKRIPSNIA